MSWQVSKGVLIPDERKTSRKIKMVDIEIHNADDRVEPETSAAPPGVPRHMCFPFSKVKQTKTVWNIKIYVYQLVMFINYTFRMKKKPELSQLGLCC